MIRIILADDHNIVRRGLVALLQLDERYRVVGEAADGEEALERVYETACEVVILDLAMPRLNGIEAARRISRHDPALKIIILSMYEDNEFIAQALEAGATGYLLKTSLEDELFTALEQVMIGKQFISERIDYAPTTDGSTALTSREREVLQLIAEGHNTTEISELMQISPHTASRHRANLMKKLDAHTQAGLVRNGIERGLILVKRQLGD